jgi:hypothetical protein
MYKYTKYFLTSVLALSVIGCDDTRETTNTNKLDVEAGGCLPGEIAQGGACISLAGATPCKTPIHTDYDGDSQCLEAPDPTEGMQLHYGPSNYDDPNEVSKFLIQPGDEYVDCMFMKTPNVTDVHMNNYHVRLRPGTHHMITYVQPETMPDSTEPELCNQGASFQFLVGATAPNTDISSVGSSKAPEYDGAAMLIKANSQVAVQMHFINVTDKPRLKEGWINALYVADEKVKMEINPITWIGGLGMNIPPRTNVVTQAGGSTCTVPEGTDYNIIALVAHMHSHTKRVSAYIQRAGSSDKQKVYEDYNWEEPTFLYYNSQVKNPAPDPITKTTGGFSGILVAHPGDQLSWECEVHNDSNDLTLQFGDKALTGEMCNMFGVYGPALKPWSCFSF